MEPLPASIMQLVLLILCGILNVMTVALEELNISALRKDAEEDDSVRRLLKLKENEGKFIVAYGFWAALIYICVGILTVEYLEVVYAVSGALVACLLVLAIALASLIIGRLAPLRIGRKSPETIANGMYWLMKGFYIISVPFVEASLWLAKLCAGLFGVNPDEELEDVTEEEIRMLVDIGTETGVIAPEEQELIQNIFEFDSMSAADVMTHRIDVAVLRMSDDPREWEKLARDSGFSRFPVCGKSIDDIVGVVHARELYEFLYDGSGDVHNIIRKAYIVPETVSTDVLFRNMQQEKNHMAVVVDEYGGFSGIVTMDDLLEELVGHINDEKEEQEEQEPIIKIDDNTWEIDGTAALDDVSEELGVKLPTEEYDTIGGLIFAQMDTIPDDGSTFEIEAYGLAMKIVRIAERRIERVLVCVVEEETESGEEEQ